MNMLFYAMIKGNKVVCLHCSKETVVYSCTTILLALSSLSVHKILFNNLNWIVCVGVHTGDCGCHCEWIAWKSERQ